MDRLVRAKDLESKRQRFVNSFNLIFFVVDEIYTIKQSDAEKEYIKLVDELSKAEKPVQETSNSGQASSSSSKKFKEILVSVEYGSVYKIVLNRPSKLNAITFSV